VPIKGYLSIKILPANLSSIRPIGIGTATHAMTATKDLALEFLSPNQYAIGLSSDMYMITQTIQTYTSRYITNPTNMQKTLSRAILVLDLINMFSLVSMIKSREVIHNKFPHLPPCSTYSIIRTPDAGIGGRMCAETSF